MTQDEAWSVKYDQIVAFMQENQRNPSRYDPQERGAYCNWIRHNRKLMNAGRLKDGRLERFRKLLEIPDSFKRVNQYV